MSEFPKAQITTERLQGNAPLAFGAIYLACGAWLGEQLPPDPLIIVREYGDGGWLIAHAAQSDTNPRVASALFMPAPSQRATAADALAVLHGLGATHGICFQMHGVEQEAFNEMVDMNAIGDLGAGIAEGVHDAIRGGGELAATSGEALANAGKLAAWLAANWLSVVLGGVVVALLVFGKEIKGAIGGAIRG